MVEPGFEPGTLMLLASPVSFVSQGVRGVFFEREQLRMVWWNLRANHCATRPFVEGDGA